MCKAQAVVVGMDHINTLGIIRSLGEAGIKPSAIIISKDKDKSWSLKSKYLNKKLSCVIPVKKTCDTLIKNGEC